MVHDCFFSLPVKPNSQFHWNILFNWFCGSLQEGRLLDTVSRCICFRFYRSSSSFWCDISCDYCSQTMDGKCKVAHTILNVIAWNLSIWYIFSVSIITDRCVFSLSSSPYSCSYWCYPSLGVKKFLLEKEADIICLLSCLSFGFGSIPCWMVSTWGFPSLILYSS